MSAVKQWSYMSRAVAEIEAKLASPDPTVQRDGQWAVESLAGWAISHAAEYPDLLDRLTGSVLREQARKAVAR